MSVVVTDIGTNQNSSGASVAISGVTVPAGASICVTVYEFNTSTFTFGALNDGFVNSYSNINNGSPNSDFSSNGVCVQFYVENCNALTGATLTYNKHISGAKCCISAFYVTGLLSSGSEDLNATGTGSSSLPQATATTPTAAGEFVWAATFANGAITSFTQDSGDGAYATPPTAVQTGAGAGSIHINGGNLTLSGTPASITYAPLYGASVPWLVLISTFKPASSPSSTSGNFFQFFG